MNNFDPKSIRFLLVACAMLLIFTLVISHAYKYLPQNDTIPEIQSVEDINSQRDYKEEVSDNPPQEVENYNIERKKEEITLENKNDAQEIAKRKRREQIEQERAEQEMIPVTDINEDDSFQTALNNANKSFNQREYTSAIEAYKAAITLTENKLELALCYDDLAKIYAMQKKYGSAIAYAQKAYNAQQTADREFILARLNYKVGNTERANELLKRSLQREFNF